MTEELTRKILGSLKGFLDITVTHPQIAGRLIVKGASNDPRLFGWLEMPPEMQVSRPVYCCRPAWDESAPVVFVFMDEVEIVDAPAELVVIQMINSGIVIVGIDQSYSQILIGAVVILAVLLDQLNAGWIKRRMTRRG
jgi:hypothetical protein